jgi:hypothetical protein
MVSYVDGNAMYKCFLPHTIHLAWCIAGEYWFILTLCTTYCGLARLALFFNGQFFVKNKISKFKKIKIEAIKILEFSIIWLKKRKKKKERKITKFLYLVQVGNLK